HLRVPARLVAGPGPGQDLLTFGPQGRGLQHRIVGLVGREQAYGVLCEGGTEGGHAIAGAGADARQQGNARRNDGPPHGDAVIEVGGREEDVGLGRGHSGGDAAVVLGVAVVGEDAGEVSWLPLISSTAPWATARP